jgi:hypothetical protein
VKVGNQGADFGCHVLLSTEPEAGLPNTYTCAIERISGLPPGLAQRLLSKLLHYEYEDNEKFFTYPRPGGGVGKDGQPRTERCCPHVDLRGRPSDTLIADINAGHITGVSLVKIEPVHPLGGSAFLTRKSSELKLSIDHGNLPANVWNGLRTALIAQATEYPVAKLSYKLPNAKRTVTVEIDSQTGAPLEDLYVKMFEISNIFPFLAQSTQNIVNHLRDIATPIMISHRNV